MAPPPRAPTWVIVLALAVAYVVTGRLGLVLAHEQANATLVWPPTGVALAALLRLGMRVWPGVFLGALVVNLLVGTAAGPSLGIAVGNTLESVTGVWLLRAVLGFDPSFSRLRDVVVFIGAGALGASLVAATAGVGSLFAAGLVPSELLPSVWLTWWLGDAGGAAVVASALLLGTSPAAFAPPAARPGERALAWTLLATTVGAAFFSLVGPPWLTLWTANLTYPLVAWVGLRFGHRGAAVAIALVSVVAVVGTSLGLGPFAHDDDPARLLLLWAYLTSTAATALSLVSAQAERENRNRRHIEDERRSHEQEAEQLHRQRLESLGLLAGGVAHDFNNLLTAVRANAKLLSGEVSGNARELVDDILLASDRAADMCRALLAYSGKGVRTQGSVAVDEVVRPLERLLKGSLPPGMSLGVEVQDHGAIEVLGDKAELTQVLLNLALNASQAPGASRVKVWAGWRTLTPAELAASEVPHELGPGEHVVFEVTDDGAGIPPAVRARLFEPFFTTREGGRGLGLAAVLGVVRAHRGALLVETAPQEGTRIAVVFPAAPRRPRTAPGSAADSAQDSPEDATDGASEDATEDPGLRAGQGPAGPPAGPQVVLLADDEDAVRKATARTLRALGHTVVEARDGLEAEAIFRERQGEVTVAVLDVTMPRCGGLEALARLRGLRAGLPVVLVSGYTAQVVDPVALAVEFVAKPFTPEGLGAAIDRSARHLAPLLREARASG